MSMNIPTGTINAAGVKLADIADSLGSLAHRASSLGSEISNCYMGAGVGSYGSQIASTMGVVAEQARSKSSALVTAAMIYENAENALVNHAETVGRNIAYGYNYAWVSRPDIQAIVTVVPAVVESCYKVTDSKNSFISRVRDTATGVYGGVMAAVDDLKSDYANHGRTYDVLQYGKCIMKAAGGVAKIVTGATTIAAALVGTAATAGAATYVGIGGVALGLTEIISGCNDVANASVDACYVYSDSYEKVGTKNCLKDYLAECGRETGAMLGNEELGEAAGKLAYSTLDMVSFGKSIESLSKSFGLLNTAAYDVEGFSSVLGESHFEDVIDHEYKLNSTSGMVRHILDVDPSSTGNLAYEAGESVINAYESLAKYRDSVESSFE